MTLAARRLDLHGPRAHASRATPSLSPPRARLPSACQAETLFHGGNEPRISRPEITRDARRRWCLALVSWRSRKPVWQEGQKGAGSGEQWRRIRCRVDKLRLEIACFR